MTFNAINEVLTSFTTARKIPYSAEMLATSPEEVYDLITSFELCKGDKYAADVSELVREYIMEEC